MPTLLDPNASAPRPLVKLDDVTLSTDATPSTVEAEAIALAKNPPPRPQQSSSVVMIASLAAFVAFDREARTLQQLMLLVAVLFFHEMGHVAGMRWFGYRDVRILFVPFFGALASGMKVSAPVWQRAIVLLLGPLPGLAVSLLLYSASVTGIWRALAAQLLLINGLNLLPLVPLDGGGFVQLLFAGHPRLQSAFSVVGLLVFGGFAFYGNNWLLVALALFLLPTVLVQLDVAKEAAALRSAWGTVPPISEMSDAAAHDLFARVDRKFNRKAPPKPAGLASLMRIIHERATTEPISASAAAGLVTAYAAGFAFIFADILLLRVR
jgi:Zn-dependent protease